MTVSVLTTCSLWEQKAFTKDSSTLGNNPYLRFQRCWSAQEINCVEGKNENKIKRWTTLSEVSNNAVHNLSKIWLKNPTKASPNVRLEATCVYCLSWGNPIQCHRYWLSSPVQWVSQPSCWGNQVWVWQLLCVVSVLNGVGRGLTHTQTRKGPKAKAWQKASALDRC